MTFWSRRPRTLAWIELQFVGELDIAQVQGFVHSVVSDNGLGVVTAMTVMDQGAMRFLIGSENPVGIRRLLSNWLPTVAVFEPAAPLPRMKAASKITASTRRRMIRTDDPGANSVALLQVSAQGMTEIRIGRRLAPIAVPSHVEYLQSESLLGSFAEAALVGKSRPDVQVRRSLQTKYSTPGAECAILFGSRSDNRKQLLARVTSATNALQTPGLRLKAKPASIEALDPKQGSNTRIPLSVDEIVAVLGWPYGERTYPGVGRDAAKLLAPKKGGNGRVIGASAFPGADKTPIQISLKDGLRHLHVLGPTGTGKSTLLLNLILQDIDDGRGTFVVDPKGDLINDILDRVSRKDQDRIRLIDPTIDGHILGFNPLDVPERDRPLAVEHVLHIFKSLNSSSWGPRTSDILHASLLTIASSSEPTIANIPKLLIDQAFRRQLLASLALPEMLDGFWVWFEALSDGERSGAIAPLMNKLRPFLMRPTLAALIGNPTSYNPKDVFIHKHVLLVNLATGSLGAESAQLLGALVLARIWQTTQAQGALPGSRRPIVNAYLDEFQNYLRLPTDLSDVLAQSRSYGLGLTLAHQHLGQLTSDVAGSVLANAQNRVAFRLDLSDAKTLASNDGQLDAEDFTRLKAFECYTNVLASGTPTGWTSTRTLPAPGASSNGRQLARELVERRGVKIGKPTAKPASKRAPLGSKRRKPQNPNDNPDNGGDA